MNHGTTLFFDLYSKQDDIGALNELSEILGHLLYVQASLFNGILAKMTSMTKRSVQNIMLNDDKTDRAGISMCEYGQYNSIELKENDPIYNIKAFKSLSSNESFNWTTSTETNKWISTE